MTHLPSKGGVSGAVGAGCRGKRPRDEAQEVDEIGKIVLEMAEEEEGGRKEGKGGVEERREGGRREEGAAAAAFSQRGSKNKRFWSQGRWCHDVDSGGAAAGQGSAIHKRKTREDDGTQDTSRKKMIALAKHPHTPDAEKVSPR